MSLAMVFLAILCFSQEGKNQIKLGLVSGYRANFEYMNGQVKEMGCRTYHIEEENGNITKGEPSTIEETSNMMLRQPWSYFFNEDGQLVQQMLEVDSANTWTAVIHHENGRIEKLYWMIHDTLISYEDVLFPEEGTIEILLRLIEDNTLRRKVVYELDKNDNLIRSTIYRANGEVNKQEGQIHYEYDAQGNWIQRYYDGRMITERKIIYYE